MFDYIEQMDGSGYCFDILYGYIAFMGNRLEFFRRQSLRAHRFVMEHTALRSTDCILNEMREGFALIVRVIILWQIERHSFSFEQDLLYAQPAANPA